MINDDVREIKSKLDIAEIIGDYVSLRLNGRTYWGKCPFHNEKTPSFSVSQERQTFHCFGCGKGGDVFTFIMDIENIDFRDALERLAERAGVKLHAHSGNNFKGSGMNNINIHTCALDFFIKSLEGSGGEAARAYLKRRNINYEASVRFGLGWAPSSWDSLIKNMMNHGFTEEQMIESGFAVRGNKGIYDRFRGRIMFPIHSAADRLIGFGGRILDGDGAKYLNSPETPLFNKRNNLYLLNKAKASIKEKKYAVLVEGYMDAIRSHLAGFTNTVASLGTALTEQQAILIKRMTGMCYICYDSDNAGKEAALRGMYVLQKHGVSVRIATLSGGKDPDEILQQDDGVRIFESVLKQALPLPMYHAVLRRDDIARPEKSQEARDELLNGLASLSPFDVMPYLEKIGQQLGVFSHELKREIDLRREKLRDGETKKTAEEAVAVKPDEDNYDNASESDPSDGLECAFCSMLWNINELRSCFTPESVVPFVSNPVLKNIAAAILTGESPEQLETRWRQMGDMKGLTLIAKGNSILEKECLDKDKAEVIAATLRKRCIEEQASVLKTKMANGTATKEEQKEHLELTRILKGGKFGI
mgnify:CR=1 FL=1